MSNSIHDFGLMAQDAFKRVESGEANKATGMQVAAAAIMFRHVALVEAASKASPVPALSVLDRHIPDNSARAGYLKDLTALCLPARMTKDDGDADTVARHNTKYQRRYAVINRALQLCVDLSRVGVTVDAWDDAKRHFKVPAAALMLPGDVATGDLAGEKLIGLDGKSYAVVRDKRAAIVYASVAQIVAVAAVKAGKTTKKGAAAQPVSNGAGASTGPANTPSQAAISTWSFDHIMKIAGELLNRAAEIMAEKHEAVPVALADLEPATRAGLEAAEIFLAECRAESKRREAATVATLAAQAESVTT